MKLERGPRAQVHDIFVDIAPLVFGCGVALWQRPATIDPEQATVGIDHLLGRLSKPLTPHAIALGSLTIVRGGVVGACEQTSHVVGLGNRVLYEARKSEQ